MSEPTTREQLLGKWRIVQTSVWGSDALDLLEPACIEFEPDGLGAIRFSAVSGGIDYRVSTQAGKPIVEFTWRGTDECDPTCGRATAGLDGDELVGTLFVHLGEESTFVARRWRGTDDS